MDWSHGVVPWITRCSTLNDIKCLDCLKTILHT